MKNVIIWISAFLIILIAGCIIFLNYRANTPYGKLDYKSAIVLLAVEMNPDPRSASEIPVDEQRRAFKSMSESFKGGAVELAKVEDIEIPGQSSKIPIRIYTPVNKEMLPVILYFHGGGWMVGDINTHDYFARVLSKRSSCIVVSVDYRLAPEFPYPAAVNDAYTALKWIHKNAGSFGGDAERIAVAGDSAGGNLAAVISMMSRDRKGPEIKYQILLSPALDLLNLETQSYKDFANGYFLTKKDVMFIRSQYLPDKNDWKNPYASPLCAKDHSNLPPAVIVTAQFDVLRDEAQEYHNKLISAGVQSEYHMYEGMIHDFAILIDLYDEADEAVDRIVGNLKKIFDI